MTNHISATSFPSIPTESSAATAAPPPANVPPSSPPDIEPGVQAPRSSTVHESGAPTSIANTEAYPIDKRSHRHQMLELIAIPIHTVILIAAILTLYFAIEHEKVANELFKLSLRGTQYQNAFVLLDQSLEITDHLIQQDSVLEVLEHKTFNQKVRAEIEGALEKYQVLLFKGAVLEDKSLTPPEFWKPFVSDFCQMYETYPYIQEWWARQKTRQPYSGLSARYRDLNYECQGRSGNLIWRRGGGAAWLG